MRNRYRERVEALAKELGIELSIAMDIAYLDDLRERIVECAKRHPELRYFPVENPDLENYLEKYT